MIYLTRGKLLTVGTTRSHGAKSHLLGRKFENKAARTSPPWPAFVSEVPLCNLRPSIRDFVSCDRIVQRTFSAVIVRRDAFIRLKRMGRLAFFLLCHGNITLFRRLRKLYLATSSLENEQYWFFSLWLIREGAFPKMFKKVMACFNLKCPKL